MNLGAKSIAVPCPPLNDTEPARTPITGGCPVTQATAKPVKFWMNRYATATTHRIRSGLPPARRVENFDDKPIVVKSTMSSVSLKSSENWKSSPNAAWHAAKRSEAVRPPETGSGMLYSRRNRHRQR